jgi:hypothetical protein
MRKLIALLSRQGTACSESVLCNVCDTPGNRRLLDAALPDHKDPDSPIPGWWRVCSENDAIACGVCGYGSRQFRFDLLIESTKLDYQGVEQDYDDRRYVLLSKDPGSGLGYVAWTDDLDELASLIGGWPETVFAFAGWYDMDDEEPHPQEASWEVCVSNGSKDPPVIVEGFPEVSCDSHFTVLLIE